jgi:cytochrome d ubiquinol oxidase subunit I
LICREFFASSNQAADRPAADAGSAMHLDPVFLSRVQFVWVIALHILLPAFTVGLASFIACIEGMSFFTGRTVYARISQFWIRIFSVAFGMGVVSGIVMPFQFGTNWSRFSDATANVIAPLLAYEGLTAFFLEATFLGVLLLGRRLVPRWVHFMAAVAVALGTLSSSFWILAANSWMQTPAGYALIGGRFFPTDWWAVIFNPSFPYRLAHTVTAFYISTGFVVLGIGVWMVRARRFPEEGRIIMSATLWLLLVLVPLQIGLGDLHGLNTLRYQPTKLAALEGRYDSAAPAPLTLFGIPDDARGIMRDEIAIPRLGSLLLTHSWNGRIRGLNDWPVDRRPPVGPPFYAFRIMVGAGLLMLALVVVGNLMRRRDAFVTSVAFLRACQCAGPLGFIAVLAGWTTTEVGRQPWTVFGLLRTSESVTPSLTGPDVLLSLLGYITVYAVIFPGGFLVMRRIVRAGPQSQAIDEPGQGRRAMLPNARAPELTP